MNQNLNQSKLQYVCEDCSYPPNFLENTRRDEEGRLISCVTCRDCGDYWEEFFDGE